MSRSGFLIAAPQSGSGKTTVSLAIMAALHRRGLVVAPFKCGPDFIDPGYHQLITGRTSINLDGWMCPELFIRETFQIHSAGADLAVIEGVMGLFDGIGSSSREGSSAQIAAITGAPVVLVVNARGMAASAAALVTGFAGFDPQVRLAGVIFNNVGSQSHGALLREALAESLPEVPVFGCILRDESLVIPSRHLGLTTVEDNPLQVDFIDRLADMAERCLDLDGLARLEIRPASHYMFPTPSRQGRGNSEQVRIAVARDAAFCFCYEDNLRLLREAGAEIIFFSPLDDIGLPADTHGIYLPGGYPELYAEKLAGNNGMLDTIRTAVETNMPVYAECGGLIYLSQGMEGGGDFAGIFPVRARMLPKRKALGYRQVELKTGSVIGTVGAVARGHEFHYSEIGDMPDEVARCYQVTRQGQEMAVDGYQNRNCLASYVHLHIGSNPSVAISFVKACRSYTAVLQVHSI